MAASSGGFKLDLLPSASGAAFRVRGDASNSSIIQFTDNVASAEWGSITTTASLLGINHSSVLRFNTNNTERMRIDSSGNVIQTAPTTAPTLSTNGTMVFNLTSNTNLRVSVRGSDGVTRTANITLA